VRRVGRQPCPSVPAAGFEPAASASSARRSYRLSYTGMSKRPWWESNPRHAILQIAASPLDHRIIQSRRWDSNPLRPRYEGGARPVEHRRHLFRAASVGVEPTRPRFRASVPCRGPGQKSIQSQRRDSNPHAPLYRRGARPVELHWRSEQGWVVGYDPTPRRSQGRVLPLHHTHHQSRSSTSRVRSSKSRPASSR
jgi:hypothetical protein